MNEQQKQKAIQLYRDGWSLRTISRISCSTPVKVMEMLREEMNQSLPDDVEINQFDYAQTYIHPTVPMHNQIMFSMSPESQAWRY